MWLKDAMQPEGKKRLAESRNQKAAIGKIKQAHMYIEEIYHLVNGKKLIF